MAELRERKLGERDRSEAAKRDKKGTAGNGKRTAAKGDRIKAKKVKGYSDPGGQMIDMRDKMKAVTGLFGGGKMMGMMKEVKGSGGEMSMMMIKGKWRRWQMLSGGSWKMIGGKMKMSWVGLWMLVERRMREAESWD